MPTRALVLACVWLGAAGTVPEWGDWLPPSEGWHNLMNKRAAQIARLPDSQQRFDGYIGLAISGILTPNFTTLGFSVVPQPPGVHERLNRSLHEGLEAGPRSEHFVDQISGPDADFVNIKGLGYEIMRELLPAHEAWIGGAVPLRANTAYGLRVYREGNSLTMHTDRVSTHVVSSILHVDRDVDEPWPIVIEGFDGNTYEVDLQPGEMLFYEAREPRARAARKRASARVFARSLSRSGRSRPRRARASSAPLPPAPPRSPPSARTAGRAR